MTAELYCFDAYCLDVRRAELRCNGEPVRLEPQVFDLLLHLVRNRDRVVSKDDLIAGVWRGRIVSESTLTSRITAVRQAIGDSGEHQRLLRTVRARGYRFVGSVQEQGAQTHAEARDPDRSATGAAIDPGRAQAARVPAGELGLAVLPFANLSADPALAHFIDGIVEDLAIHLSKVPWLRVASGRQPIGARMLVRYVLEGSARKAADGVRIWARLIDAGSGAHLWAYGVNGEPGETLDLQGRVAGEIVARLVPRLERIEIGRAKREPDDVPEPNALYLRGLGCLYRWSEFGLRDALRLFHQAADVDPDFAAAYGMAAYCHVQRKSYGWSCDPSDIAACEELVLRAVDSGKDDAATLARAAHGLAVVVGDVDAAVVLIEESLRLDPGLAVGWYVSGWIRLLLGETDVAIDHLTSAVGLGAFDPLVFKTHAALAYANFFAGREDDACFYATRAMRVRPNYLTAMRGAAAGHAFAGRLAEARTLVARMRALDSTLCVSRLPDLLPFRQRTHLEKWAEGLYRAGLPD